MRHESEATLDLFRLAPRCQWCGGKSQGWLDPHHLKPKGAGGGSRLDVSINLIALCRTCHNDAEAGVILEYDLLAVVAQRESCLQPDINVVRHLLLRLPKDAKPQIVEKELSELSRSEAALANRVLKEMGR